MRSDPYSAIQRRDFLKLAGATTVVGLTRTAAAAPSGKVSVIVDSSDPVASGAPVTWAVGQLRKALASKGAKCELVNSPDQVSGSSQCIVVAGAASALAKGFPRAAQELAAPGSLRLAPGTLSKLPAILVSAVDTRGFVYGLLELAERVQFNADPRSALHLAHAIQEQPANDTRCVSRYFCSEMEDKSWYYDKDFWPRYLDTLVVSRFNRFTMAYGLEYDFPRGVTDDYLHLPYPYFFEVPGFRGVRVMQLKNPDGTDRPSPIPLSTEERDKNFEMLKFIAAETGARGLHFQLGIWTHAYKWTDSPNAYHNIEGLTPETHASYCRDALAIILKECPQIQGLSMRVHGESGIPEGSYPFWKTLFEAIADCGRTVEVDMHAKGVNQTMIDIAVATGMPVTLGAKYSAEHQSLGYNQADIRTLEIPHDTGRDNGPFSLSSGARLFTRYGYGDFFQQGSKARIVYRLWPGSQRHLISADPEMAAAYSRTSHFCGAAGIDLMEPLTFKGREGSGSPGGRCAYLDESLTPKHDWEKFEYYYRVWGRKLYDPDAEPEIGRRYLKSIVGPGAVAVETALANSSRITPLITSAHLTSASNHAYWVEMTEDIPVVAGVGNYQRLDTPSPKCFAAVSPLDPELFSTVIEHTRDVLAGRSNPKYSPIEVAQWLEDFAVASRQAWATARIKSTSLKSPQFRRIEEDVLIQNSIGIFFAAKMRSSMLFQIFLETGSAEAATQALAQLSKARAEWARMAERASKVYKSDVGYGDVPLRRGHWSDRIPGIDADIAAMKGKLLSPPAPSGSAEAIARAIRAAAARPVRPAVPCTHGPDATFHPGKALHLSLQIPAGATNAVASARLHYRHVNQAERWLTADMQKDHMGYSAEIPAEYTDSVYPLQYYFELDNMQKEAWLYPAFNASLSNQPYYAIFKRS